MKVGNKLNISNSASQNVSQIYPEHQKFISFDHQFAENPLVLGNCSKIWKTAKMC